MSQAVGTALPRSTPREQGVDAQGVAGFLDAVEAHPDVEMHSVMVLRHGHVVAEGWWAPYSSERLHLLYSLSKSFTSAALGLAVAEGLVGLDDTVLQHLPELGGDDVAHDPRLRHLAAMASGHTWDTWDDVVTADRDEPVRAFLRLPPDGVPGERFAYNQSCTHTVAAVLQHVTGSTLDGVPAAAAARPPRHRRGAVGPAARRPRHRASPACTAAPRTSPGSACCTCRRAAGAVPRCSTAGWVREATTPQVSTAGEDKVDWTQGYGFQFWGARHGYRGDGAYGQYCVVLPEHDAVVAVTGASPDMQAVLDAMWEHLLPAFGDVPLDDAAADDALASRLAALELPLVEGDAEPDDPNAWEQRGLAASTGPDGPHGLDQVVLQRRDGRWWLHLDEQGETVDVELGTGGWATTEDASSATRVPVATTGAWRPDGLHAVLTFLETPHSLRLRLDPTTGTAHAEWVTAPLHGTPLAWCAAPPGLTAGVRAGGRPGRPPRRAGR